MRSVSAADGLIGDLADAARHGGDASQPHANLHEGGHERAFVLLSEQVIRETPASRGTETSAEELVGPPWRMVSNAGQQQCPGVLSDQVIREDPAVRSSCVRGRGTETSAEVLVGPPWRMESNAGQQQWWGVHNLGGARGRGPRGPAHPDLARRPIQKRKGLRAARAVQRTGFRSATSLTQC